MHNTISRKRLTTIPDRLKLKLWCCVMLGILILSLVQTGCATKPPVVSASLSQSLLVNPPVLRLLAGQTVQTLDGPYQVQQNEIWHSDGRFRVEEQQLLDATTALNELKNQPK